MITKILKNKYVMLVLSLSASCLLAGSVFASSIDDLRQELENQIIQKQQEINQHQQIISEKQQESKTLNNEIAILENEIQKVRLEINQIDLNIQKSDLNIAEIDQEIAELEQEVDKKKVIMAEYIRTIAYNDQETLLEVVLKNDQFSDFFEQINAYENVQDQIHTVLDAIGAIKESLLEDRERLDSERQAQNRLKSLQLVQRRSVENVQSQKESLLNQTKGEESKYQQLISGAQKEIAQIKEQLSMLERYNITLNDAVQYAIYAGAKTGIRPAYLLGVLEAESRLGLNVGTGTYAKDMYQCYRELGYLTRAEKEKAAFLQICSELGINPDLQPVSAEPWYGCGGAMGVAQFMPTTWLAYRDQVVAAGGNNPPSPWNHKDAFLASAIKLSQGGANQRTEIGERTAYAKYLAGGNYQKWIYHSVTNYVIKLAANFQQQYFD